MDTAVNFQKKVLLQELHARLEPAVTAIMATGDKKKVEKLNALIKKTKAEMALRLASIPDAQRVEAALLLQYCISVVALEYRHRIRNYEYMDFSRRIGELWEAFCKTAWVYASNPKMKPLEAADFNDVRTDVRNRLCNNIDTHKARDAILADIDILFDIIGDINMNTDAMCEIEGVPYIIDFKSGFGSKEKGNKLRLDAVGRAYRIWKHETQLLMLVRKSTDQSYLDRIRKAKLWDVHIGSDAYDKMRELTGVNIKQISTRIIDWQQDLSREFLDYLKHQPTNLTSYLDW